MDNVAQRMADHAASLVGALTDAPHQTWEEMSERQREYWREMARVSQEPKPAKGAKG